MEISDSLKCLFSAQIEEREGSYVIEVPAQEQRLGDLDAGETYRVAVLPTSTQKTPKSKPKQQRTTEPERSGGALEPPVSEGESRVVEIEGLGEQGDGIARVDRGFVVIIPETEMGERVRVEITDVRENVAFATVVERLSYYE